MGKRAAFLKSDGTVVDLDGTSQVSFVGVTPGPYYVVVRHRNHLSVMSATVTPLGASSSTQFDFTTGTGQYFGGSAKDLGGGKFGMFAGNNDGDNVVTVLDYNAVGAGIFTFGYMLADHDMEGLITVLDYNHVGQNLFMMSSVP
jgi:hypothetical protein